MSSVLTEPPFRADHVGSLLRPPILLAAREAYAEGRLSAEDLHGVENEAITAVIELQEEIGLRAATDGEFRRTSWHMDFIYQLGGISKTAEKLQVRMRNAKGENAFSTAGLAVTAPVRLAHPIFADDFRFLAEHVGTAIPKLTIPSPSMVHYRAGTGAIDRAVYPDVEQFWHDLSAAYADEVRALGERGCRYLQFDDTSLAYLNDPAQRAMMAGRGEDGEHQHLRYIQQINGALAGRPPGRRVTSKRPELESKDLLKRRVDEASKYVPLDQLCLSPQCGFSSTVEGNALTLDEQAAKLRLIVEVAEEIWS